MVIAIALRLRAMVFLLANVKLTAEDRLNTGCLRVIEKVHRAEDVAVIGHSDGRHLQFLGALAQQLGIACTVEHGVVGMKMQMNEIGRHGYRRLYRSASPEAAVRMRKTCQC